MGCETYGVAALAELQIDLDLPLMLFYGAHPFQPLPRYGLLERGLLLQSPLTSANTILSPWSQNAMCRCSKKNEDNLIVIENTH